LKEISTIVTNQELPFRAWLQHIAVSEEAELKWPNVNDWDRRVRPKLLAVAKPT